jgi:hypothetical protein
MKSKSLSTFTLGTVTTGTTTGTINLIGAESLAIVGNFTQVGTTSIGTQSAQLTVSVDGTTFVNYGTAVTFTGTAGNFFIENQKPTWAFAKLSLTGTAGTYNITVSALTKTDIT